MLHMTKIIDNLFYKLQMYQIFTIKIVVLNASIAVLTAETAFNRICQFFTVHARTVQCKLFEK